MSAGHSGEIQVGDMIRKPNLNFCDDGVKEPHFLKCGFYFGA